MNENVNKDLLMQFIKKGGSVAQEQLNITEDDQKLIPYQVRMPKWLIAEIDALCKKHRPVYCSRHSWVMDAILNKLIKEEK